MTALSPHPGSQSLSAQTHGRSQKTSNVKVVCPRSTRSGNSNLLYVAASRAFLCKEEHCVMVLQIPLAVASQTAAGLSELFLHPIL